MTAGFTTVVAGRLAAVIAIVAAAVADILFAVIAATRVIFTGGVITDPAPGPIPVGQRDIGAAAVVGQQCLLDDQKEITEAPIPESILERN
jgi:hypothetical protein